MREIKFRAWCQTEFQPKMVTKIINMNFDDECLYGYNPSKEHWSDGTWYQFQRLELMQYTGLKDKNGKEIYKGDIVTCVNTGKTVKSDVEQVTGQIVWDNEGADYNICNASGNFLPAFGLDFSTYGVIGNIYENKELLK